MTNSSYDFDITGDYRTDIVVLSTILNGREAFFSDPASTKSQSDQSDSKQMQAIFTHLSHILTLGTTKHPYAQLVHAVAGCVKTEGIQCTLSAQNMEQEGHPEQSDKSNAKPPPLQTKEIKTGSQKSGSSLLNDWANDKQCDYGLEQHVVDVCAILTHLRALSDARDKRGTRGEESTAGGGSTADGGSLEKEIMKFQYLVHRRAFRKLAWRIGNLNYVHTRDDDKSPFSCLIDKHSNSFDQEDFFADLESAKVWVPLNEEQMKLWGSAYEPIFQKDLFTRNGSVFRPSQDIQKVGLTLTSENAKDWLRCYDTVIGYLRRLFPKHTDEVFQHPDQEHPDRTNLLQWQPNSKEEIEFGVGLIQSLATTAPILKNLLCYPKVKRFLDEMVENNRRNVSFLKQESTATSSSTQYLQLIRSRLQGGKEGEVNSDPSPNSKGTDTQRGIAATEMDELEDGEQNFAIAEEKDSQIDSASVPLALRLIYTIHSWSDGVRRIAFTILRFPVNILPPTMLEPNGTIPKVTVSTNQLETFIPGIVEKDKQFQWLRKNISKAKIHAEAALMAWVHKVPQATETGVAIAASKKCCFLCWFQGQQLNKLRESKLILQGTHRQIFTWIAPEELPPSIVKALRDELINQVKQTSADGRHSTQSSADSIQTMDGFKLLVEKFDDAIVKRLTSSKV